MMALAATILLASLLGSLHCAGMCGAFALFAIGAGDPQVKTSRSVLMGAYHLGRLVTYIGLGVAAGALGSVVDLTGDMVGIGRAAAIGAGALMVVFGGMTLLRLAGVKLKHARLPQAAERLLTAGHRRSSRLPPLGRAMATGLLTTLLPCGWLYAFVITAAGTAHPLAGGFVMAVFWVGTLPALTIFALGIQKLSAPLARRLPVITASAVVVVGLYTIVARAQVSVAHTSVEQPSCCAAKEGAKP